MLLDMVDEHPLRADPRVGRQEVQNQASTLEFVLQMGRVNEDHLLGLGREIHVHFEHLQFIP
jgi:hypothetical protein